MEYAAEFRLTSDVPTESPRGKWQVNAHVYFFEMKFKLDHVRTEFCGRHSPAEIDSQFLTRQDSLLEGFPTVYGGL